MRAALYARYSTSNQSALSIEDQLRLCRRLAAQLGAHVVREFTDAEISGFVSGARPGLNDLLAFARAREADVVIAEHSDRLSRDGEKSWQVFNLFQAAGIRYVTVQEGEVTIVHQGVSSLVSELKGQEARQRTHRGLQGVVESGRSAGGLTYGYRKKRLYDDAGEPIRGHLEIDEDQAQVVQRIFRDYAAGASPLAIAHALNVEGVPSPRGGGWNASTIGGNAKRGNGVLHNELYLGVRVWGRRTFVKDRQTGARRGREAAATPIRREVPELRIIDEALWRKVRARYAAASTLAANGGATRARRPTRLLSGLIVCGVCGAAMRKAGPREALRCATRIEKGVCSNTKTPGYSGIEARVVAAIRANLLHPAVIEHAIRLVQEGLREARRDLARRQAKVHAEIAEVERRLNRLVDQVEQGVPWKVIAGRHAELESRLAGLKAQLAEDDAGEVVPLLPTAAGKYRQLIEQLSAAMDEPQSPEDREGREAVRALIHQVRVTPGEGHGEYALEIVGDLAPILMLGTNEKAALAGGSAVSESMSKLGAGTRVTRRHTFSAPFRQVA